MRDKELYAAILGVRSPWLVSSVELDAKAEEVRVRILQEPGTRPACPVRNVKCAGYDKRERAWRHLDTCQFKTILIADIPV